MGHWGQKYVLDNYTWEHVAANIEAHIDTLLNLHQQGFEVAKHQGQVLGMIFRQDTPINGLKFFTDDMNPFQIGVHNQPRGVKLAPHIHKLSKPLTITSIQELICILTGKARVTFYTQRGVAVEQYTLERGDAALFISQGHGVDFIEPTRLLIV